MSESKVLDILRTHNSKLKYKCGRFCFAISAYIRFWPISAQYKF